MWRQSRYSCARTGDDLTESGKTSWNRTSVYRSAVSTNGERVVADLGTDSPRSPLGS